MRDMPACARRFQLATSLPVRTGSHAALNQRTARHRTVRSDHFGSYVANPAGPEFATGARGAAPLVIERGEWWSTSTRYRVPPRSLVSAYAACFLILIARFVIL